MKEVKKIKPDKNGKYFITLFGITYELVKEEKKTVKKDEE